MNYNNIGNFAANKKTTFILLALSPTVGSAHRINIENVYNFTRFYKLIKYSLKYHIYLNDPSNL